MSAVSEWLMDELVNGAFYYFQHVCPPAAAVLDLNRQQQAGAPD